MRWADAQSVANLDPGSRPHALGPRLSLERSSARTPASPMVAALRRLLVAPRAALSVDAEAARATELVAGLALVMVVTLLAGIVYLLVNEPLEVASAFAGPLSVDLIGYGAAYVLARTRSTRSGAWLVVLIQLATPLMLPAVVPFVDVVRMHLAPWVVMGMLTASATLDRSAVLWTGVGSTAGIVATWTFEGGSLSHAVPPAFFTGAATAALFVYSRHRDALESARQQQLCARNADLEDLRASLEDRVRERTAQLEEANRLLVEGEQTLIRTEKLAAVGRLTAGLAHELATPLSASASALATLDALREEYAGSVGDESVTADDHRAIVSEMLAALKLARGANEGAIRFVRGIRAHTRDPGPQATERFDANVVVAESADLVRHVARSARVELIVQPSAEPAWLRGVPSRLSQVLTNLVQNAVDAVATAGRAAGRVELRVCSVGSGITIEVADDGTGIEPGVAARIFEPFYTTKPYGKGTGLGLAIVDEIVRSELHGQIDLATEVGQGSTFAVKLPRAV
jgi:signal transduction histidine kinase